MVTLPVSALAMLLATGEGVLIHCCQHSAEGYPLGHNATALVAAIGAAESAIKEAK